MDLAGPSSENSLPNIEVEKVIPLPDSVASGANFRTPCTPACRFPLQKCCMFLGILGILAGFLNIAIGVGSILVYFVIAPDYHHPDVPELVGGLILILISITQITIIVLFLIKGVWKKCMGYCLIYLWATGIQMLIVAVIFLTRMTFATRSDPVLGSLLFLLPLILLETYSIVVVIWYYRKLKSEKIAANVMNICSSNNMASGSPSIIQEDFANVLQREGFHV